MATSVLALAGVTFSGTLVALTLASSQFGPRLLRNFVRANITQLTLGSLLATHVYCLVVLRNVRIGDYSFIPHYATFGAFLLTLLSLAMFIFFIHYIVVSIQAEHVVADVFDELSVAIDDYFDSDMTSEGGEEASRESWDELNDEQPLFSRGCGYLQAVDLDGLLEHAENEDLRCRVLVSPGQFVVKGQPLLTWSDSNEPDEEAQCHFHSHQLH